MATFGMKMMLKNFPVMKYIFGTIVQHGAKSNATFFTYKKNFNDNPELNVTKLCQQKGLYEDRFYEMTSFFNLSFFQILWHYLRNGTPNTSYYKDRMEKIFSLHGTGPENLKKSYELASFMYINRLMLRYHNYTIGQKVLRLNDILLKCKVSDLKVLDYGCGVADPSLLLAIKGANVTIVDLADNKFEFAKSRFSSRHLPFQGFPANQTEDPVDINGTFNVILMSEFLEHTRSPMRFLKFALYHLEQGGLFYDSLGATHKHGVGGDHLQEAKVEMDSTDYEEFFKSNFNPVNELLETTVYEHFYIKR